MVRALSAAPAPPRRRRRARPAQPAPPSLPLARVTAIRAFAPFDDEAAASRWLQESTASEEEVDAIVAAGIDLLNRALHVQAVAAADPRGAVRTAERAIAVRIGYGSGEQTADGEWSAANEVDVATAGSSRRRREEDLRPQERLAAVLGGRERIDACETLLLRARADLDAGRRREAALQLRVALEAMLVELAGALADPGHEEDMATLEGRRAEVGEAANIALRGDLDDERERSVRESIETAERVLRRRRVLRG